MKSLAFDTLLGIFLGFSLFFYAIFSSTTNWQMFIDLESFLMVAGGTFAATMISFRSRYVMLSFKELIATLIPQNINPETLYSEIENIINWARIAKQNGLRELEIHIRNSRTTDEFMRYGGNLLVTGYRGDELRTMLTNFTETTFERNMVASYILKTMAGFAPAFGMLGTVVGLIIMLDNMGNDPSKIGEGLAFALITTLYGVLLAHLILKPAAEKAKQKQEILRFRNLLVTEGLVMLGENKDSMTIQDTMNSFLSTEHHFSVIQK